MIKSNVILKQRKIKYNPLKKNLIKEKIKFFDYDFFFEIDVNKSDIIKIKNYVFKYIGKSLKCFNKNIPSRNLRLKSLLKLPNITPNGVIKVKKENKDEYIKLQTVIIKFLKKYAILKHVKYLEFIEVRLMRSTNSNYNSNRAYSSSKIHTDNWSGNPCDAKAALFMHGDKKNTIEFFSPKKIDKTFFTKKINYEKAIKKYGYKKIKKFNTKKLTIFDQSCLHQTKNKNCNLRLSIDFGLILSKNFTKKNFLPRYRNNFFNPSQPNSFIKKLSKKKLLSIYDNKF